MLLGVQQTALFWMMQLDAEGPYVQAYVPWMGCRTFSHEVPGLAKRWLARGRSGLKTGVLCRLLVVGSRVMWSEFASLLHKIKPPIQLC